LQAPDRHGTANLRPEAVVAVQSIKTAETADPEAVVAELQLLAARVQAAKATTAETAMP